MARISDTNKRYRSKEEIAKDVAFILNAPLKYGTQFAVLNEVTWVWTEFYGKYKGCTYRSEDACKLPDSDIEKYTIHEHLVPKSVVIAKLFALKNPTSSEVYHLLDQFLIGVLITKEEDQRLYEAGYNNKMPEEFDVEGHEDHLDPWVRYKRCNIIWRDCRSTESKHL